MNGVVLAGGRSSRMRVNKALLPAAPGDGRTLAERQLELLRRSGALEVFLSLRPHGPGPAPALTGHDPADAPEVVYDEAREIGPLGGIVAGMRRAPDLHLLVLAVDMAAADLNLLATLVRNCTAETGAVPRVSGRWEPLCAVYPPRVLKQAEARSRGPDRAPSSWVSQLAIQGLVRPVNFRAPEAACLKSWNRPEDLPAGLGAEIVEGRHAISASCAT